MRILRRVVWGAVVIWWAGLSCAGAQQMGSLADFARQISETQDRELRYDLFEQAANAFFKEQRYDEFLEFIKPLAVNQKELAPVVNYYLALTRYFQLKHLESAQDWEAYFAKGSVYRDEIAVAAQMAVDATLDDDPINLYALLVLWRFHSDQQDAFADPTLAKLMANCTAFAKKSSEVDPLKAIADQLMDSGEKGKARHLFKLYAQKVTSSQATPEQIHGLAAAFYSEGNLELAQAMYSAYAEKVSASQQKEDIAHALREIALKFSYSDKAPSDPSFAEEYFKRYEAVAGKEAFDETALFARANNLERLKEYPSARVFYQECVARFPSSRRVDQARYKSALISAYVLSDVLAAKQELRTLAGSLTSSPMQVLAWYHLGLLSQWGEDFDTAREHYSKALELARSRYYEDAVIMAQDRLREIDMKNPMEYNLKMFLDASLRPAKKYDGSKISLKSSPYRQSVSGDVHIVAQVYVGESGCIPVDLQYLWSGNLGKQKPSNDQSALTTQYSTIGVKEVFLVGVSPSGVVDKAMDFILIE
jgi:hypothetical protein